MYIYIHIYIYVCVSVLMYISLNICIYTYVHTCTYTYTAAAKDDQKAELEESTLQNAVLIQKIGSLGLSPLSSPKAPSPPLFLKKQKKCIFFFMYM